MAFAKSESNGDILDSTAPTGTSEPTQTHSASQDEAITYFCANTKCACVSISSAHSAAIASGYEANACTKAINKAHPFASSKQVACFLLTMIDRAVTRDYTRG